MTWKRSPVELKNRTVYSTWWLFQYFLNLLSEQGPVLQSRVSSYPDNPSGAGYDTDQSILWTIAPPFLEGRSDLCVLRGETKV